MTGPEVPKNLSLHFDPDGFHTEVRRELREEKAFLTRVRRPLHGIWWGHAVAIALLALSALAICTDPRILYLWVMVGLLLYSYNFVILLFPTTAVKARPNEAGVFKKLGRYDRLLIVKLLFKNPKLAVELGLTIFLGGMIPLVLSFTIIFGLGFFFAVYFAAFTNLTDWNVALAIMMQVALIMFFYVLISLLQPESQGITRFARVMKRRLGRAQGKGRLAQILFFLMAVAVVAGSAVLVVGAVLLPGSTLSTLWNELTGSGQTTILSVLFVVGAQLFIMRHFQSVLSRHIAIRMMIASTDQLSGEVLPDLERLMGRIDLTKVRFHEEFLAIRRSYYSQVIYDIIPIDILGRSHVYLVGLRLKYVLDDDVLRHLDEKIAVPSAHL